MSSLSERIDHLSSNARHIKSTARETAVNSELPNNDLCPFTRALLGSGLGDLIRDADNSEVGLFSLVDTPSSSSIDAGTITQATEVKRTEFPSATPLRKYPMHKDRGTKLHEIEPETYARAALKYIDRYQPIRTMPRAEVQIEDILLRVHAVRQNITTYFEEEEHRIQELQKRIAGLKGKLRLPPADQDNQSERPSRLALSTIPKKLKVTAPPRIAGTNKMNGQTSGELETNLVVVAPSLAHDDYVQGDESKVKLTVSSISPQPSETVDEPVNSDDATMSRSGFSTPRTLKKVKIDTDVESIVSRIWSTVGDIIVPGNDFGTAEPMKPPHARATIQQLQLLSNLSPTTGSPATASSLSSLVTNNCSAPTAQQILTAYLLIILLCSPPNYSLPLNRVKELLALKANAWVGTGFGQSTNRVLYGCVAKRLVRIDRSGGEQIVKYDI